MAVEVRRTSRRLVALLAVALVVPGPAVAQVAKAGVVTSVEGSATVARASLSQPAALKFRDDVFEGDRVATGDRSLAKLLLGGKAVITVRERSVVTLRETPGTSTVDVASGFAALSVAKDRMRPNESINIRTPNAIAGVRGTVVLVEVTQATSQTTPGGGAFTTLLTLLVGSLLVNQRDAAGNPLGAGVLLGPLQQTSLTGAQPPRPPITISIEVAQRLAAAYRARLASSSPDLNSTLTNQQLSQTLAHLETLVGNPGDLPTPPPRGGTAGAYNTQWGPTRSDIIEAIKVKLNIAAQRNTTPPPRPVEGSQ